jgi:hypothetical protein
MTAEESLKSEQLKNIDRGLTFETEGKKEENEIEQEAEQPKRNMERARSVRKARPGRSRKRT